MSGTTRTHIWKKRKLG